MPDSTHAPDPIDIAVGLRIRTLRKERRMSQAELGAPLGITFQQVQKYERGVNRISASMLVKAAKALSVTTAELLPQEDEATVADAEISQLMTSMRGAEELIQAYAAITSPRLRRAVLTMARSMAVTETEVAHAADE